MILTIKRHVDDTDIYRALNVSSATFTDRGSSRSAGTLLRASFPEVSPLLLQKQFLHQSILLLLQETGDFSIGMVLNLVSTDSFEIQLSDGSFAELPIRYGGPGGDLIWLNGNPVLKEVEIGKPIGGRDDDDENFGPAQWIKLLRVWHSGIRQRDFFLVRGFCV